MTHYTRHRFHGHIAGAGTAEGTRLVLGCWTETPHGAFADVMVERPDGHRLLLAPDDWVAEFVTSTYTFDDVLKVPVVVDASGFGAGSTWTVCADPLQWEFRVAHRNVWGQILRGIPHSVASTHTFARLTDLVAPRIMPGVRTLGTAGGDRTEWYAAHDLHSLADSRASWDGVSLGNMMEVWPSPSFGFSSTPRVPSLTAVTTTVQIEASDQSADHGGS